jgi:CRP-like cAMP-binding protein
MQSGQMRFLTNYNNVLTLGVSPEGLFLASMFLFRFMHPPLLIPWSEIKVQRKKGWIFEYVILTLGHELAIPLRIRAKLATKVRESAGVFWPMEEIWSREQPTTAGEWWTHWQGREGCFNSATTILNSLTRVFGAALSRKISEHKQGDFFGELAILMATAAPASVRAKTACHLARLDPQHLQELIRRSPECSAVILQTLNERVQIVQKYMLNLPSSREQTVRKVAKALGFQTAPSFRYEEGWP